MQTNIVEEIEFPFSGVFIPRELFETPNLILRDKWIWVLLNARDNPDGCWVDISKIAKEAGVSIKETRKSLKSLIDAKLLDIEKTANLGKNLFIKTYPRI